MDFDFSGGREDYLSGGEYGTTMDFDFSGGWEDYLSGGEYGTTMDDWVDDDWLDYEDEDESWLSGIADSLSAVGSSVLEWGVANPGPVFTGISGAAGAALSYLDEPENESQTDYYRDRNARHDQGMRDYVASKKAPVSPETAPVPTSALNLFEDTQRATQSDKYKVDGTQNPNYQGK